MLFWNRRNQESVGVAHRPVVFTLTIGKTHSHDRYAARSNALVQTWMDQSETILLFFAETRALDLSPLHAQKSSGSRLHMCCVELALDRLLCTHLGSKGFLRHGFSPFINPTVSPRWWAPMRAKQLSVAATARVIWLCACERYWPGRGLVYVCPLL